MGNLIIAINNRSFQISCADGDENHVMHLADELAKRVETVKTSTQDMNDSRLLVLASLMLCDEVYDLKKSVETVQSTVATIEKQQGDSKKQISDSDQIIIDILGVATKKIQNIIEKLILLESS